MAANNSSVQTWDEISLGIVTNAIMPNQTFFEKLASVPTVLLENIDLLSLEFRIVFTALACIYISSHGALRRPPSAKLPKRGKNGEGEGEEEEEEEAEERDDQYVQGLILSDAIMFPILAGTVLIGLYYLIKWFGDSDILNQILRAYFSLMSLASLAKFLADGLHFLTGFAFPSVWIDRHGRVYHIDSGKRGQCYIQNDTDGQIWDDKKVSPLPSIFSELKFSEKTTKMLWEIRHLFIEEWTVRVVVHGVVNEKFHITFNDIFGAVLAIGANLLYYTTDSTFLSNILGYGLSYTSIIIMSPTTFITGSSVLYGLFFYDIVMVFYTPYMVTVATKIDAPVKLVFQSANKAKTSMLGLGDIVIPGMFIALCLRFDHYMHYYRQQKLEEVELKADDASSGQLITSTETQRIVVKPDYINPQGQWGNRFWATKLSKVLSPDATPALKASTFPKPYFHAAMVGYLLAMVATLAMLLTFKHAQPALLYLVPGVVTVVWLTGLVRGEISEMWNYTEDGSLDMTDVIVEVDGEGNIIKQIQEEDDWDEREDKHKEGGAEKNSGNEENKEAGSKTSHGEVAAADKDGRDKAEKYPVFLFSIEAPTPKQ
ncbi:signal peptide peptidase-domain-containing protein [Nemania sp. NC0429]|nr:signal peptide peptidase-domain-containing protein [Nemania sp. NC0429]